MLAGGAMEVCLPLAPRDAPRCNLEGYGLFKGAGGRVGGSRKACAETAKKTFVEVGQVSVVLVGV